MSDLPKQTESGSALIWWGLAFAAVLAASTWYFVTHGPVTGIDRSIYGDECATWISERFGDGQEGRVLDAWKKRGRLVFEIAVPEKDTTYSSVYLCVVDKKAGHLTKPSAFDQSWRR